MSSMINVFLTITAWMKTKQGCSISAVNFIGLDEIRATCYFMWFHCFNL